MATLIPSINSYVSRMTSGERRLVERLEAKLDADYRLWYDVPMGPKNKRHRLGWRHKRVAHMNDITNGAAPTPADNLHAELRRLIATNLHRVVKFAEAVADTAIVSTLSAKNLRRMVQFSLVFAQSEIVVTLSRKLSWSHFLMRAMQRSVVGVSDPSTFGSRL
jgi:hypothetical protein